MMAVVVRERAREDNVRNWITVIEFWIHWMLRYGRSGAEGQLINGAVISLPFVIADEELWEGQWQTEWAVRRSRRISWMPNPEIYSAEGHESDFSLNDKQYYSIY
jgi:hypothetical protein